MKSVEARALAVCDILRRVCTHTRYKLCAMTDTLKWKYHQQWHPHLAHAEAQEKWMELQAESFLLKLERLPGHYSPHTGAILMRRECEELVTSNALLRLAPGRRADRFVTELRAQDALKSAMEPKEPE